MDAFGGGRDDAVLRPRNDERALLTPSELHQAFSFTARQASLLLLPLGPGDLRLDPEQGKKNSFQIPYGQWLVYSRLGCAYSNRLLVSHSSFLRKFTEAKVGVNSIGLKDGSVLPSANHHPRWAHVFTRSLSSSGTHFPTTALTWVRISPTY